MALELLLPAKDYNVGLTALYSGADAIYFGMKKFGARAYATNFSLEEASKIADIAHALGKKVYVTFNTIVKDSELEEAKDMINKIALCGVDGLIMTDYGLICYALNNTTLEVHISTQVGLKTLADVRYFEGLGAKRAVLAREAHIDDIKKIKENVNIELEIFIHGALCVSYSGSCYLSSILSLRSGNRGRCSQNCRRAYSLYEDGKEIVSDEFLLSMKDLKTGENIKKLKNIGIDSLKIEGRMKDKAYVYALTRYYRMLLNGDMGSNVDNIFHRQFTKGFLFGEDRGNILDSQNTSNLGQYVGKVIKCQNDKLYLDLKCEINPGDRLRIEGEKRQYFDVEEIQKENKYSVVTIDFKYLGGKDIYKMKDINLKEIDLDSDILPLDVNFSLKEGEVSKVICRYRNRNFSILGDAVSTLANTNPLTEEMIYEQFNKLNDTPFFINQFNVRLDGFLFLPKSEINNIRRKLVDFLYSLTRIKHEIKMEKKLSLLDHYSHEFSVYATCRTTKQADLLISLGIDTYYLNQEDFYTNRVKVYQNDNLVCSYGQLNRSSALTLDNTFNIINHQALAYILKNDNVKHVNISKEASFTDLVNISNNFYQNFGFKAPIDYLIYGKEILMRIKACPLKRLGKCGTCQDHKYQIGDNLSRFDLLKVDCNHDILNGISLNLIDKLDKIKPYVNRVRLDFTTETEEEIREIISQLNEALADNKEIRVSNATRGYFGRSIL